MRGDCLLSPRSNCSLAGDFDCNRPATVNLDASDGSGDRKKNLFNKVGKKLKITKTRRSGCKERFDIIIVLQGSLGLR